MRRTKTGFTRRQYAYAKRTLGGDKDSKKDLALAVGYSPSVAHSVAQKIENTEGFDNAMALLASESGNLMMKIYHTLNKKDLSKESVPVLLNAVTTMANAWQAFTPKEERTKESGANKLRSIVLNRIENQTINVKAKETKSEEERGF